LTGRPVRWHIGALDEPDPIRHGDAETAASLRAAAAWLRTMFAIVPLAVAERGREKDGPQHALGHETAHAANAFADPYQVPDANFGWSARDACYSYGSFVLDEDEALVITHRPPSCRFWNLVVWNQFMATFGAQDARCSLNGHSAVANSDGSVTVVLSRDKATPEFSYHAGLSARKPGISVVSFRRSAAAARGETGQGGRRPHGR